MYTQQSFTIWTLKRRTVKINLNHIGIWFTTRRHTSTVTTASSPSTQSPMKIITIYLDWHPPVCRKHHRCSRLQAQPERGFRPREARWECEPFQGWKKLTSIQSIFSEINVLPQNPDVLCVDFFRQMCHEHHRLCVRVVHQRLTFLRAFVWTCPQSSTIYCELL